MTSKLLQDKHVVITGGTGSLGKVLLRRLLGGEIGTPSKITVFSRDEGKQHAMRVAYLNRQQATDEVIYNNFRRLIEFRIGDVRDIRSLIPALMKADVVVSAAALKQVPACEYFPEEAVRTNIGGAENIVAAIRDYKLPVETVVSISTDKACKPVNVMGMTKALQERIFLRGNLECPGTRFINVRYGNVLASRGSVIPLFHDQIRSGGPVTITHTEMTRFLLSLDQAVDIIFEGLRSAKPGETYIPIVPTAKVTDIAEVLIGDRKIKTSVTGIRPGEKLHEILISEEEAHRAFRRGEYYVIPSILPELDFGYGAEVKVLQDEYSSEHGTMTKDEVLSMLKSYRLLLEDAPAFGEDELIR